MPLHWKLCLLENCVYHWAYSHHPEIHAMLIGPWSCPSPSSWSWPSPNGRRTRALNSILWAELARTLFSHLVGMSMLSHLFVWEVLGKNLWDTKLVIFCYIKKMTLKFFCSHTKLNWPSRCCNVATSNWSTYMLSALVWWGHVACQCGMPWWYHVVHLCPTTSIDIGCQVMWHGIFGGCHISFVGPT